MENKISAIDIKKLFYSDYTKISADLTASALKTLLEDPSTVEIENIHQDTWTIDEEDASQDEYKNQLTGMVYRMGSKSMGSVTFNFTIGQYDYTTKKALMGGEVITDGSSNVIGWKRARGIVEVRKALIALTEDDVYCVLPEANIRAREANTDGAVGIAVIGTMLEPKNPAVDPEYWFDASEVNKE